MISSVEINNRDLKQIYEDINTQNEKNKEFEVNLKKLIGQIVSLVNKIQTTSTNFAGKVEDEVNEIKGSDDNCLQEIENFKNKIGELTLKFNDDEINEIEKKLEDIIKKLKSEEPNIGVDNFSRPNYDEPVAESHTESHTEPHTEPHPEPHTEPRPEPVAEPDAQDVKNVVKTKLFSLSSEFFNYNEKLKTNKPITDTNINEVKNNLDNFIKQFLDIYKIVFDNKNQHIFDKDFKTLIDENNKTLNEAKTNLEIGHYTTYKELINKIVDRLTYIFSKSKNYFGGRKRRITRRRYKTNKKRNIKRRKTYKK